MLLKSITVHQYGPITPGTRLEFTEGINLLTDRKPRDRRELLRLITRVVCWDFGELPEESIALDWEWETPDVIYRIELRTRHSPSFAGGDAGNAYLEKTVHVRGKGQSTDTRLLTFQGEYPPTNTELWVQSAGVFDNELRFLRELLGTELVFQWKKGEPRLRNGKTPLSRNLVQACAEILRSTRDRSSIVCFADKAGFGFLEKFEKYAELNTCEFRLREVEHVYGEDGRDFLGTYAGVEFRCHWEEGRWNNQHDLFFEEKRYLSFLFYSEVTKVLLLEELFTEMAEEAREKYLAEFGERQVFITAPSSFSLRNSTVVRRTNAYP